MGVFTVTILSNGQKIDATFVLIEVDIIHEVNKIPYAELVFEDGDASSQEFIISNSDFFLPGKEIEISIRYENEGAEDTSLFKGVVIKQAIEADNNYSSLRISLKDKVQKATRNRHSNIYQNLTDTTVATNLLDSYGLTPSKDNFSSEYKYPELVQYHSTDWDFIISRLETNGLWLFIHQGTYHILDPTKISLDEEAQPLAQGTNIYRFSYGIDEIYNLHLELDAESQIGEVSSTAWDLPNQKVGQPAKSAAYNALPSDQKPETLADAVGTKKFQQQSFGWINNKELEAWSNGKLRKSRFALIRGTFSIQGLAGIKPLEVVEIDGISSRFKGKAIITAVRHRITVAGWFTDVQLGMSEEWFSDQHQIAPPLASGLLPAIQGLHIGVVDQLKADPLEQYRILVSIPAFGDQSEPIWARWSSPDAGKNRGYYFRPEPGDEVVVGFLNNDPRQAIVLGSLYSQKNTVPPGARPRSKRNNAKGIFSRSGVQIIVDDAKRKLQLRTAKDQFISIDQEAESIALEDVHGNYITLDKDGVYIFSIKNIVLEASEDVIIRGLKVDVQ